MRRRSAAAHSGQRRTADKLIRDKLGDADWKKHLGQSESLFVNASTWGLMLTGKLVNLADDTRHDFTGALRRLVGRAGEPVIRLAVRQAMRIMGHQFVMGRTIDEALDRSAEKEHAVYRYSYDMLGEVRADRGDGRALPAGLPQRDQRDRRARRRSPNSLEAPSISVKLSALHPRYEVAKRERARRELGAEAAGALAAGDEERHRALGRRRRSRSPRTLARHHRRRVRRIRRSKAGTASASSCRRITSARRS